MNRKLKILSIIAGAMIIAFSCSKETVNNENTVNNNKPQLSEFDKQVNKAINSFKQKMAYYRENPQLKSGESVPADSALWYLESTINYSHAFPNEYYYKFEVDTSYLTVPVNTDGTVDMAILTQKYDEMKTNVADDYHNSTFSEKGLSYVNITEVSQTNNELNLMVESGTGDKDGDPKNIGPDGPFGDGDDWWYGEDKGHCDWDWVSDAAKQLKIAMNNDIPDPNGNYFFIGLTTKYKRGGDLNIRRLNDPDPPDNTYDYYLYSSQTDIEPFDEETTLCLDPVEMNTYFQYLRYLLYTKIPDEELPEGYKIESVVEMKGWWEDIGDDDTHYYHEGTFQFGLQVGFGSPDEGPEEL